MSTNSGRSRRVHALRTGGASESLVEATTDLLRECGETVCTVESCTGGLIGSVLAVRWLGPRDP